MSNKLPDNIPEFNKKLSTISNISDLEATVKIVDDGLETTKVDADLNLNHFKTIEITGRGQVRYERLKTIGEGASGYVFEALDKNLDRLVAIKEYKQYKGDCKKSSIKSTTEKHQDFIREARITAKLEHPNIVPVYDMDLTETGNIYFAMKRIAGKSLSYIIKEEIDGKYVMPINEKINIILKVCDGLSYAHNEGVIHQDVKPSNIMIGEYGEVLLVDWGTSFVIGDSHKNKIIGSPAYMSPEQACRKKTDARSDIYCLAATLYQFLSLKYPIYDSNNKRFWEKKRSGHLDPISKDVRDIIPSPLLAIIQKGLSVNPESRYQSAKDFADDLKQYQSGQNVKAHNYTLLEHLKRSYKAYMSVYNALIFIIMLSGIFGYYIHDKNQEEIGHWGKPFIVETFDTDSWKSNWIVKQGNWKSSNGSLETSRDSLSYDYKMLFNRKLYGDIAIEYDAKSLPGSPLCDISAFWCTVDETVDIDIQDNLYNIIYFQVGAVDNEESRILQSNGVELSSSPFKIKSNVTYRVRVEVEGKKLRLFVDGNLLCSYKMMFNKEAGYFGLYGYYAGKSFDNVKIYQKGVPEKISVMYVGDERFLVEDYDSAISNYSKIVEAHSGTALAEEALYKIGASYFSKGNYKKAFVVWDSNDLKNFKFNIVSKKIDYFLMKAKDGLYPNTKYNNAFILLEDYYKTADEHSKKRVGHLWSQITSVACNYGTHEHLRKYLEWGKSHLDLNGKYSKSFMDIYNGLGRLELYLKGLKLQKLKIPVLISMGKYADVFKLNRAKSAIHLRALYYMGDLEGLRTYKINSRKFQSRLLYSAGEFEKILSDYPEQKQECVKALLALDRAEDVLKMFPNKKIYRWPALVALKRWDEIYKNYRNYDTAMLSALLHDKKYDEAIKKYDDFKSKIFIRGAIGMDAAVKGDLTKAEEFFVKAIPNDRTNGFYAVKYFLAGMLKHYKGDDVGAQKYFQDIYDNKRYIDMQIVWYMAGFILNKIDEKEFLSQPMQFMIKRRLAFSKALKADLNDDKDAAGYYKAYLSLPRGHRLDPIFVIDRFCNWRIKILGK